MDISSTLFGFTPTNLGRTPAQEINPFTDVCCFLVREIVLSSKDAQVPTLEDRRVQGKLP
jgi:hypothetical protein